MKINLIVCCLFFLFQSCFTEFKTKQKFIITNNSGETLKNIVIEAKRNKTKFHNLGNMESINLTLDISSDSEPRGDGSYILRYEIKGENVERKFGYYTNNGLMSELYSITILDNEIKIVEE